MDARGIATAIQAKVDGEEVTAPVEEAPKAQIVDLMEALKASLGVESAGEQGASGAGAKKAARKGPRRSPRTVRKSSRKKAAAN